jgi:hypothetical protein
MKIGEENYQKRKNSTQIDEQICSFSLFKKKNPNHYTCKFRNQRIKITQQTGCYGKYIRINEQIFNSEMWHTYRLLNSFVQIIIFLNSISIKI